MAELYLGDSLELMRCLPPQSIDLIITSPPYNVGLDYDVTEDSKTSKEFAKWNTNMLRHMKRLLQPKGRLYIAISDAMMITGMFYNAAKAEGFALRLPALPWCKPNSLKKYGEWSRSTEHFLCFTLGRSFRIGRARDSRNYFEFSTLQGEEKTKGHPCLCTTSPFGPDTVVVRQAETSTGTGGEKTTEDGRAGSSAPPTGGRQEMTQGRRALRCQKP